MKKILFTDADFDAACWEVLKEYVRDHPKDKKLASIVAAVEAAVDTRCKGLEDI